VALVDQSVKKAPGPDRLGLRRSGYCGSGMLQE